MAKSWLIALLLVLIIVLGGCGISPHSVEVPALQSTPSTLVVQYDQFDIVTKDGVQVARPKNWQSQSDPNLVYSVSHSDFIRITVAVLPAFQPDYYENLVKTGTVTSTTVAGYLTYYNEYTYPYHGSQLTTECYTMIQGDKACHIMILCDVALLGTFQPVFEYIIKSVKFQ